MENQTFYLGLDLSTQSLKLYVFDQCQNHMYHDKINFKDIPDLNRDIIHLQSKEGVTSAEQDVFLFLKSLQIGLKNLNDRFARKISAISVSGQQHGSVYYSKDIKYETEKNLVDNLEHNFATNLCPIWMDSSTSSQCKEMDQKFKQIHQKTGSRPFERFTYSQILKKYQTQKEIYDKTIHISLISSFVAEVLTGSFCSIDYGDASGMNLMDLKSKKYIQEMIDFIPGLQNKLGEYQPVKSWSSIGKVHNYFQQNYSNIFDQDSIVIASTGDNLASMVGMGLLDSSYIAISLGTSDTLFGIINEEEIEKSLNPNTPIFASPLSSTQLLCQKNGGLMRDDFISQNNLTWNDIEDYYFQTYKPKGYYGCFLQQPEIVPPINIPHQIEEIHNINEDDKEPITSYDKVIILLEYKLISMKVNYQKDCFEKLILTGGACKNRTLQQLAANIFCCPVFTQTSEDSAAVGSALRAHHGQITLESNSEADFKDHFKDSPAYDLSEVAQPNETLFKYYQQISQKIQALEQSLIQKFPY